jgi:hypothetical protein
MKWSQLKKRIEDNFADSVKGRVEVWNTRYRKAHDDEGKAWITIDKQRVFSIGTYTYDVESNREAKRIQEESGCTDYRDPNQYEGYRLAHQQADKIVHDRGVFPLWKVNMALFDSLSMSIENIIKSENPIIRAFGIIDKRFGKRRLREFDDTNEHTLVRMLYRFRCEAEGIKTEPKPSAQGGGK